MLMWLFSPLDVNKLSFSRHALRFSVGRADVAAKKLMAVPAGAAADVWITLGDTSILLVDRALENVRLRPGPNGRTTYRMVRDESVAAFTTRVQAAYAEAKQVRIQPAEPLSNLSVHQVALASGLVATHHTASPHMPRSHLTSWNQPGL